MASTINFLRLLADPTRLRLLLLLEQEELSVAELQDILGMGQSRISSHLAQLKRAGVVEDRRAGKNVYYGLTNGQKLDRQRAKVSELTCALAREMIQITHAYNTKSIAAGLPPLELGIGICFQDSAPMYLMDGPNRIMISKALNESDRLSSCSKGARKFLTVSDSLFNVYAFQSVDDEDTGGMPEEFLIRYNIGGVHINKAAFEKLRKEISLQLHEMKLPVLFGDEIVKLYSGMVPLASGSFQRVVVREGRIPHIDARDFSLKQWTDRPYFELVTNPAIYEYIESGLATTTASAANAD